MGKRQEWIVYKLITIKAFSEWMAWLRLKQKRDRAFNECPLKGGSFLRLISCDLNRFLFVNECFNGFNEMVWTAWDGWILLCDRGKLVRSDDSFVGKISLFLFQLV